MALGSLRWKRFTSQSQYIGDQEQGFQSIKEMEQPSYV